MLNYNAKVTDLVKIKKVPDKYISQISIGDIGRIVKIYSNGVVRQIKVNIFGKLNPHTRSDGHFIFWPSELIPSSEKELYIEQDIKNTKNSLYGAKGDIMKNKQLLKGYKIAIVRFEVTEKEVPYALYDSNVEPNDYVLCMTGHHGQAIGEVKEIICGKDIPIEYGREIICKIDYTDYRKRQEKLKRIAEIKLAMAKKKEELNELAIYELLAKSSPEMANMLKELKELV